MSLSVFSDALPIKCRLKASDGIVSGGGGFLPGAADFGSFPIDSRRVSPLFSIITETVLQFLNIPDKSGSGFPPARE
ncbi:hypothetical protein [Neisseria meningitidis]|uniref:hypothetical protein n=1 Tax=Neisseria meningitidis TaxID=487 RepID=UPI0011875C8C